MGNERDDRRIRYHAHCRNCLPQKPLNQSPSEWARLDAGLTERGLLIWCKRCRMTIEEFTPFKLDQVLKTAECEFCARGEPHVH
jgi:hypothetical protein